MSKIGNKIIIIPKGVTVEMKQNTLFVKGPKGELKRTFRNDIDFIINNDEIILKAKSDTKFSKSLHGLYRNLTFNMIIGVETGFKKKLLLNGVGYRVKLENDQLNFSLGYSHPILLKVPDKIKVEILENGKVLILESFDKEFLGDMAAKIRQFRVPEPYKKKGIQYHNEVIKQKAGKSSKK